MGYAGPALECVQIVQIPLEIAQKGIFIGVFRLETEHCLCAFNGDEGVFGGGFVDPLIQGDRFNASKARKSQIAGSAGKGVTFLPKPA